MMKKWKNISLRRGCVIAVLIYCVCAVAVYWIAGDQFRYRAVSMETVQAKAIVGQIMKGYSVKQTFLCPLDNIDRYSLEFATYSRKNQGNVTVAFSETDTGKILFQQNIDVSTLQDNAFHTIEIPGSIRDVKGKRLQILVTAEDLDPANAITLYYGQQQPSSYGSLTVNGNPVDGTLCLTAQGSDPIYFGQHYFPIMGVVGLLLALYCVNLCIKEKKGGKSYGLNAIRAFTRYRFLLDQLVGRDFKTKYKRSVLGALWSFLNPLLSMIVQYVIFSTLFKTDIENFAVYLLIGIVFFNFFMEATTLGLTSIVSNTSLITKVYIPKYIFPVSKVLSSAINLLISLIPLILVILFTREPIRPAILLFPFPIVCTIVFCIGMAMLLASMMVFFRDTQFLWSVISMLWMYATPIFYPESILPAKWTIVFKINPLYHFIRFARALILQGASPQPQAYLFCILASVIPFLLGAAVFKKTQNKFILYI